MRVPWTCRIDKLEYVTPIMGVKLGKLDIRTIAVIRKCSTNENHRKIG